ncbi:MAG TPA: CRISPR-associated endonuclease Cas1 [Ktedonobacteraceae bacterium]|nr:CRISPR-associated endonuclease Cas1 [Ktedonobacteraceae bacterium]
MELIVEGPGTFLGKHQGRLRVTKEKKTVSEVPLIHLEQVVIVDSGVAISSDVIRVCSEEGIPIYFLDRLGNAVASLYAAGLTGTVLTRRAQLLAYEGALGVMVAKAFVTGKLENQANLLRYMAKYRKETDAELFKEMMLVAVEMRDYLYELEQLNGGKVEDMREQILSVEGRAAQKYWQTIGRIIPDELAWPGRETRGAQDRFNSALNYGYGILYHEVERALTLAGLDAYGGFLHADRPGKPSLVLDMIEEFRQAVVDRTVIGLVNKRFALDQDEDDRLSETTRHKLSEKIRERMESSEVYEKKRQALRFILQSQARHLALFLRGERAQYEPFVAGW